jgi:hypothetical protein
MESPTIDHSIPTLDERVVGHSRPDGKPNMYQSRGKLLFMHWQVSVDTLRQHIPEQLGIGTFDGIAWISVTPFTVWGARPVYTPRLPWLSHVHEINVRTYVHYDGVPGVGFFRWMRIVRSQSSAAVHCSDCLTATRLSRSKIVAAQSITRSDVRTRKRPSRGVSSQLGYWSRSAPRGAGLARVFSRRALLPLHCSK